MLFFILVFCYSIMAYGACNVIAFSEGPFYIFSRLRDWAFGINEHFGKMFKCMICLPANFGWICSLFSWFIVRTPLTPFNLILCSTNLWWLAALCDGAFTTGIVYLIYLLNEYLEKKINYYEQNTYIEETENEDMILVEDITTNKLN